MWRDGGRDERESSHFTIRHPGLNDLYRRQSGNDCFDRQVRGGELRECSISGY
jgi:hypothetical protein